jgi:ABC-type transporter Mla maintaining outer membrane lipid asymmetry ATPase subunit MlaF
MNPSHPPDAHAADPGANVIEMRDVAVGALRDQSRVVAKGIYWKVAAGEYWAVAGLQGAGKSDFLLMTAGLMPPAAGDYYFLGERMPIFEAGRLPHRLRLGLVFDGGQVFHHLTVFENVALPLCYHQNRTLAEAEEEVARWLEAMELAPWQDGAPGSLGRSWQKRVGLARALTLRPEVLLLDNPLAGLDPRQRAWWLDWLDQLARGHELLDRRPVTLVVTAGDLRPWRERARQFAVLQDRRLNVLGTRAQIEAASAELARLGVLE